MKLTISQNKKTLKTINLTSLQLKAFQLLGLKPEDYLEYKIQRLLEFPVQQAKDLYAKKRLETLAAEEIDSIIDEVEAEKPIKEEEEVIL